MMMSVLRLFLKRNTRVKSARRNETIANYAFQLV